MERTEEYDFSLPPHLIARYPSDRRGQERLMVVHRAAGTIAHHVFTDLPSLLRPGDVLVLNDTKVIPARIRGAKPTGGAVEMLLVRRQGSGWVALVRARGAREGLRVILGPGRWAELTRRVGQGTWEVEFHGFSSADQVPWEVGSIPLPPYLKREPEPQDEERYQTVYARSPGSVAAPTAGLHFTHALLEELQSKGVEVRFVTLHVGPGTFKPMTTALVADHHVEAEPFCVGEETADALLRARGEGRRVVAVGTTVTRVLEAMARDPGGLRARSAWTDLFIYPPFTFRLVGALVTNFHLPRSPLLALVAAFAGRELVMRAYGEAIRAGYMFYSYGDAMLIL